MRLVTKRARWPNRNGKMRMESVPRRRARENYDLWLCQFARGGAWRSEFGVCEMDDYNESTEGIELD